MSITKKTKNKIMRSKSKTRNKRRNNSKQKKKGAGLFWKSKKDKSKKGEKDKSKKDKSKKGEKGKSKKDKSKKGKSKKGKKDKSKKKSKKDKSKKEEEQKYKQLDIVYILKNGISKKKLLVRRLIKNRFSFNGHIYTILNAFAQNGIKTTFKKAKNMETVNEKDPNDKIFIFFDGSEDGSEEDIVIEIKNKDGIVIKENNGVTKNDNSDTVQVEMIKPPFTQSLRILRIKPFLNIEKNMTNKNELLSDENTGLYLRFQTFKYNNNNYIMDTQVIKTNEIEKAYALNMEALNKYIIITFNNNIVSNISEEFETERRIEDNILRKIKEQKISFDDNFQENTLNLTDDP